MLVAGPPLALSLLDLRKMYPKYFSSKTEKWFSEPHQRFAREDKVKPGWIAVRKDVVPGSRRGHSFDQLALLPRHQEAPYLAELIWAVSTYAATRGVHLFPETQFMRTASRDALLQYVAVAFAGERGINATDLMDHEARRNVWIAAKLKQSVLGR